MAMSLLMIGLTIAACVAGIGCGEVYYRHVKRRLAYNLAIDRRLAWKPGKP